MQKKQISQTDLIISIIDATYTEAFEIVQNYDNIELRLAKLDFSNNQIINLINLPNKTILTDIADLQYGSSFEQITFTKEQEAKLIIDFPINQISSNKLNRFLKTPSINKLLSYHIWDEGFDINSAISLLEDMIKPSKIISDLEYFDYIKIAININSDIEEAQLFALFDKYPQYLGRLILVPMGDKYKYSRVKSLLLGSPFMYCYVTKPAVKGQLSANEILDFNIK